jgi:hypothetical protein
VILNSGAGRKLLPPSSLTQTGPESVALTINRPFAASGTPSMVRASTPSLACHFCCHDAPSSVLRKIAINPGRVPRSANMPEAAR